MCGGCCRYGSGIVLEHEIPGIAAHLRQDIKEFKERFLEEVEFFNTKAWRFRTIKDHDRPYGPCIFLDGNLCKIHSAKPLHCRVGTCDKEVGDLIHAWFMTTHFVNAKDPESVRQYHAYIKTGGLVVPGAELERLVPNRTRLRHILEYKILK